LKLSDGETFDLLKYFKINKTNSDTAFLNICSFVSPKIDGGKIMSKMLWEGFILWDENLKTVTITNSGNKFIKKQKRKIKIGEISYNISFLKDVSWLVGYLISLLINFVVFLKLVKII